MTNSPIYAIPYASLDDPADIEASVNPIVDRVETVINTLAHGVEIGYDQIVANVTVHGGAGTTVIAGSSYVFDGEPVMAEFFAPGVEVAPGDFVEVRLREGATVIGLMASVTDSDAGPSSLLLPVLARLRFTPSAAAHTYSIVAVRSAADGTVLAGAAGNSRVPAYLRFTKV